MAKAKQKKKSKEKTPHPHQNRSEIFGFFLLATAVILFLSFTTFAYGEHTHNWLGVIGYTIGWIFHTSFGIVSYLISFFLAWVGGNLLFGKEIPHFSIRFLYFLLILASLSLLLSLAEDQLPFLATPLEHFFYPHARRFSLPYHLGGLPWMYLYRDLPTLNIKYVLHPFGVGLIFCTVLFASLLFFFNISFSRAFRAIAERFTLPKKEEKSDVLQYAKLRIPSLKPAPAVAKKIQPSFSLPEPVVEFEEPPVKVEKRKEAIRSQRVWNGDYKEFQLPSLNLITPPKVVDQSSLKEGLQKQAEVLEETLSSFGIEAKVGQINCGPTITSFEVHPSVGVKVQKIKALENDLALNLQAASIRIIAPIPGKAAVGVEVPNPTPQEVSFREMIQAYQRLPKKFKIPLLLGKTVTGDYVMSDLSKMPHLIIAGATGSGKSVCINTIVMSILYNAKPDEVQLVMIDPKKVELTPYSRLPHMIAPVITNPHEAYTAMQWLVKEMEKRYEILNKLHHRNIESFNTRKIDAEKEKELGIEVPEKFPYLVGIVDELADLMMVSTHDIETPIARIAQMARAVGIHLILATQRPSREVITGLIKANFPTRICFKVSSGINSKIVLDAVGGEQLLGNGDMLFLPPGSSNLDRVQGAYIRDEDIAAVIESIETQAPPNYRIPSFSNMSNQEGPDLFDPPTGDKDVLYAQALDTVLSTGNASTTFLQRKLKVGYARAASLMDQLEQNGVVGPQEGSKPRQILAGGSSGEEE